MDRSCVPGDSGGKAAAWQWPTSVIPRPTVGRVAVVAAVLIVPAWWIVPRTMAPLPADESGAVRAGPRTVEFMAGR